MAFNFRMGSGSGDRPIPEAGSVEAGDEALDRLRADVAELRASRERLVLAADADRRRIERALHEGVHQHLVALAVNLQLVVQLVDADPPAAAAMLDEMRRDVRQALGDTAELAQRVYPPLLEAGLGIALRAAVEASGIPATVDVPPRVDYPATVARTIYLCCLEPLEHAEAGARATIAVRDEGEYVVFEVVVSSACSVGPDLGGLRDRVEALGGRLTISAERDGGIWVSGVLPLTRG